MRLDDEALGRRVSERLRALVEHPSLLTPPQQGQDADSHDAVRIQNELNLALNRGSEPPEYIKTLAFAAAAARYQAIQDPTPDHRLAELRAQLEQGVSDENILQTLLQTAVNAIRFMPSKIVDLELVNGRILSDCLEGETS